MTEAESVKLVLLGDSGVGKTAIALRYVRDEFDSKVKPTIGASFLPKSTSVEDTNYDLAIWDTAGQEVYRTLTPMYYRDAQMAMIIFDVTQEQSLDTISEWFDKVRSHNSSAQLIIVGNKTDMTEKRVISMNKGMEHAKTFGLSYVECSALNGYGVNLAFETVLEEYHQKNKPVKDSQTNPNQNGVNLNQPNLNSSSNTKGCC